MFLRVGGVVSVAHIVRLLLLVFVPTFIFAVTRPVAIVALHIFPMQAIISLVGSLLAEFTLHRLVFVVFEGTTILWNAINERGFPFCIEASSDSSNIGRFGFEYAIYAIFAMGTLRDDCSDKSLGIHLFPWV
jgi:hypothetical protein